MEREPAYRSTVQTAGWVRSALRAEMVVNAALLLASLNELMIVWSRQGAVAPDARLGSARTFISLAGSALVVVRAVTLVRWGVWQRRSYNNLAAFGAARRSADRHVARLMVLPVNVWRYGRVLQDLWRGGSGPGTPAVARIAAGLPLVITVQIILEALLVRHFFYGGTYGDRRALNLTVITMRVVEIAIALGAIAVLVTITDRLDHRARRLGLKDARLESPPREWPDDPRRA